MMTGHWAVDTRQEDKSLQEKSVHSISRAAEIKPDASKEPPQQPSTQDREGRAPEFQQAAVIALLRFRQELNHQLKQKAETGFRPPASQHLQVLLPPWTVEKFFEKMLSSTEAWGPSKNQS